MTDLHAAVTAAIDGAEADARGVLALFEHPIWPAQKHEVVRAERDLRGLAEDRDILARHVRSYEMPKWPPGVPEESRQFLCAGCHGKRYFHDCPEVHSLARRHGIEVPS